MCWWHMATHWQLGVQVQEQTWVLKSQLAEAKFSARALGASMPTKCPANITPRPSPASRPSPTACQRPTAALMAKHTHQETRTDSAPSSPSQCHAQKILEQHSHGVLRPGTGCFPGAWDGTHCGRTTRNNVLPAPKCPEIRLFRKSGYDLKVRLI